jgi:uncharacterized repeat protein (TIGR03803 family)
MRFPSRATEPGLSKTFLKLFLFSVTTAIVTSASTAPAATFTTLINFNGTDGGLPQYDYLVQGFDGNIYGTTQLGGTNNAGAVYKFTPGGTLTSLYSFCAQANCADGAEPVAGLVQGSDGNLYGTTQTGGASGFGTIFKITSTGTLTTLHSFSGTDGANPLSNLILAADGNFYGTTANGGTNSSGTIFKITSSGTFTTVYNFCALANCADGSSPVAGLLQAAEGNFYGVTRTGGANSDGSVFKMTTAGALTTLHSFAGTDGSNPYARLIQAVDGSFYGTTANGGTNSQGTVFKITSTGTFTSLHSFDGTDGFDIYAGLIQATDGNFYGTTYGGGANGNGTIYEITSAGVVTTLYSFCNQSNCTDGDFPYAGLVQNTNGVFFGAAAAGGASDDGVIFTLNLGLGPFVTTQPTIGKVGTRVTILGTNLTAATSVTFNGTAATFTVVSKSAITTTVPAGATTGKVVVTIPKRTLHSNVAFRVIP